MFTSICIRRQRPLNVKSPLNAGFLAEALLYYENVHLIADRDILKDLLIKCGATTVMQLLDEGFLKISYVEETTGIQNFNDRNK